MVDIIDCLIQNLRFTTQRTSTCRQYKNSNVFSDSGSLCLVVEEEVVK